MLADTAAAYDAIDFAWAMRFADKPECISIDADSIVRYEGNSEARTYRRIWLAPTGETLNRLRFQGARVIGTRVRYFGGRKVA